MVIKVKNETLECTERMAQMLLLAINAGKPHIRDNVTREWIEQIIPKLEKELLK